MGQRAPQTFVQSCGRESGERRDGHTEGPVQKLHYGGSLARFIIHFGVSYETLAQPSALSSALAATLVLVFYADTSLCPQGGA